MKLEPEYQNYWLNLARKEQEAEERKQKYLKKSQGKLDKLKMMLDIMRIQAAGKP